MTVTEIALLRLLPPTTANDSLLCRKLAHARKSMEGYTSHRFYILQQIDDPTLLYVIGEWDTLDQHMNGYIPSAENQKILEGLKAELTVEWLLHLDASQDPLPLPKTNVDFSQVFRIHRYFVKAGGRDMYKGASERENRQGIKKYLPIGGGWRVDNEDGKEEFVLVYPWFEQVQQSSLDHSDELVNPGFKCSVDGVDIKRAKILNL